MKKLLSLLAATGLIAGSLLATTVPAHAEDITDITLPAPVAVADLVVSSKKCKPIQLATTITTEPATATFDYLEAWVALWAAKTNPEEAEVDVLYATDSNPNLENTEVPGYYTPIAWCPTKTKRADGFSGNNLTGLGLFYVESAYLQWWNTPDDEDPSGDAEIEAGITSFTVKQASKVTSAKVSKKGTKRTLSATFTYFDIAKKAKKEWTALPKNTKVELQRRAADGKGDWKKIKTVKVGSKGVVKTTYKTKATYQYRFVYTGSATKAPVTSKTLKK